MSPDPIDHMTRQDVLRLYRIMLNRQPESDAVVDGVIDAFSDPIDAVEWISNSAEFASRQAEAGQAVALQRQNIPELDVETDCDAPVLEILLERVANTFSEFGKLDPYWSVLTDNRFRMDRFEDHRQSFFDTGRESAQLLTHALTRNKISGASIRSVLELGCGVGRVTVHLADHFDRVIGVDISREHLAAAEQAARISGKSNIELVHLTRIEAICQLPMADCLYTVIVLQHNPPPVIKVMLEGVLDRVNPGGVAYFQVPVLTPGYRYRVSEHLQQGGQDIEQHAIPQRVVFEVLRRKGYEVLEVMPDTWVGAASLSCSFLARRS